MSSALFYYLCEMGKTGFKSYAPGDIYLVYISHKEIYESMEKDMDFVHPYYDMLCFMDASTDLLLMKFKIYLN